jgi:signal transduction histidine kinase
MALLAEDRSIRISCAQGPAVPVEGDRARLKQVVVNLLDNAIKYTPRGGTVALVASASGGHAALEVIDTGVGIAPEDLPRVFDRFFRAAPSGSGQTEGAGLGLAIVKSICNAHGGTVEVKSIPGTGSSFRVSLPLAGKGASRDNLP